MLGGVPGTGLVDWPITYDELEPYYTKAEWELGVSGEPGPFDPPRSKPYPMPPLPVKSSGVLLERGAKRARAASAGGADGDQLAALQRPARRASTAASACSSCASSARSRRRWRRCCRWPKRPAAARSGPAATSRASRPDADGRAHRRGLLRRAEAAAAAAREGGRAVRQRRRDAAAAAQLADVALPERPRQLQRRGRQVPDVQHLLRRERAVRASAQRVQERAEHAHRARLLRHRSASAASTAAAASTRGSGKYPIIFALGGLPPGSPTWGEGFARALAEQFSRTMFFGTHGTSLPLEANSVTLDPSLEGRLGPAVHAGHLPGSSRRFEVRASSWAARATEIAQAAGALKTWPEPVRPQTAVGPSARHLPDGQRSAHLGRRQVPPQRTTCETCSSATAAAW